MLKRLLVVVTAAGLLVAGTPHPAGAEGCPSGFIPLPYPPGFGDDRNGNGIVCMRAVAQGARIVVIDDVAGGPSQPVVLEPMTDATNEGSAEAN